MPSVAVAEKEPLRIVSSYYMKQRDFEKEILDVIKLRNLENIRSQFLIFDLSNTYWHDLGALLWLISLLHKLKKQSNDLQILLPEPVDEKGERVWDFLIRWRFFETLAVCVDAPVNLLKPEQVPHMKRESKYTLPTVHDEYGRNVMGHTLRILEMTTKIQPSESQTSTETDLSRFLQKYNDQIIIYALSQLCGWDTSLTMTYVQRVIREGLENSFAHSEGTFSNISMILDKKNLTLVICDNGIGIPKVLRNAFQSSDNHKDLLRSSDVDLIKYFTEPDLIIDSRLIKYSVEKGTSSKRERKGLGLYYLKSLVLSQGGELRIRSGRACVDFTKSGEQTYDNMIGSPGTMLRIQTPLKDDTR